VAMPYMDQRYLLPCRQVTGSVVQHIHLLITRLAWMLQNLLAVSIFSPRFWRTWGYTNNVALARRDSCLFVQIFGPTALVAALLLLLDRYHDVFDHYPR
jgi:hypothetical protein